MNKTDAEKLEAMKRYLKANLERIDAALRSYGSGDDYRRLLPVRHEAGKITAQFNFILAGHFPD